LNESGCSFLQQPTRTNVNDYRAIIVA